VEAAVRTHNLLKLWRHTVLRCHVTRQRPHARGKVPVKRSLIARLAAQRGYDLSAHVAAQVTDDDLAWADDILVMDAENQAQLARRFPPNHVEGVRLLDPDGIPDPWLVDTDAAYTDSLDRAERAVRAYLVPSQPQRLGLSDGA